MGNPRDTLDERNPAPPGMYRTLQLMGWTTYQLVQDFGHQWYDNFRKVDLSLFQVPAVCVGLGMPSNILDPKCLESELQEKRIFMKYAFLLLFLGGEGYQNMGVSKNRGTPKWMVKIMENPIKMDDLGVPLFSETPI